MQRFREKIRNDYRVARWIGISVSVNDIKAGGLETRIALDDEIRRVEFSLDEIVPEILRNEYLKVLERAGYRGRLIETLCLETRDYGTRCALFAAHVFLNVRNLEI